MCSKRRSSQKFVTLSVVLFAACSDDPAQNTDAATTDGGVAADAAPQDSGVIEDPPILSRTVNPSYTCQASRDTTDHSPGSWPGSSPSHSLVNTATGAYFARFEQSTDPLLPGERRFVISSLDSDGQFGPARDIAVPMDEGQFVVTAQDADGFVVAWSERNGVHYAAYNNRGDVRIAPKLLPTATGTTSQIAITPNTAGGFALLFSRRPDFDAPPSLFFLSVDNAGNEIAPANLVIEGRELYRELGQKIIAVDDFYLIIWRDVREQRSEIYSARLNPQGVLQGMPQEISGADGRGFSSGGGAGFSGDSLALIPRGAGALAAWTESFQPDDFGAGPDKAYSLIRIAELDVSGRPTAPPLRLQAKEDDIDNVEPTLLKYGSSIALLWGRGDHIYVCGGCIPNHTTKMVLLDSDTLDPKSNVAEIPRVTGGQLDRSAVVLGADIPPRSV